MQIVEVSGLGVRSAVYTFQRPGSNVTFVLFPMLHIGEQGFYDSVRERLEECDLIVGEGVRSKYARLLTLSYRLVPKRKRYGLVTQKEALNQRLPPSKVGIADMDGREFDREWRQLHIALRFAIYLAVPLYASYMYLFGTRRVLARNAEVNDLPSRKEILRYDGGEFDKMRELIISKRDAVVIERLREIDQTEHSQAVKVGVVYGARHMRGIINFLTAVLKYRVVSSEWLVVFEA